jgi:Zn-dependent peptidase ImmA (M78 family)/DNA-binding XRE family transcriptional regulator
VFNHKRLSLARKRRQLTGKGLAERSGLSAITISRLENGENQPDDKTVESLSRALSYPSSFFFGDDPEDINPDGVSFRSLSRMSAKSRDAALAAGAIGLQLCDWVEKRFKLPDPYLLDLDLETSPEKAALWVRQYWALGQKPIGNMIGLLETHGVRVFSLSENTASVDAFSFWRDGVPFVFLNNFKTAERSIFDAAHELGHLVMHRHAGLSKSPEAEREANAFASAFLLPADDVRARMPRNISVNVILQAKKRWRVAAIALAYRLHALGLLSDWQYKSTCIELGRRGYRSGEPDGIDREVSIIWNKVFQQLWAERTSKNEIARELDLPLDEIEGVVGGVTNVMSGRPPQLKGPLLRAVK